MSEIHLTQYVSGSDLVLQSHVIYLRAQERIEVS